MHSKMNEGEIDLQFEIAMALLGLGKYREDVFAKVLEYLENWTEPTRATSQRGHLGYERPEKAVIFLSTWILAAPNFVEANEKLLRRLEALLAFGALDDLGDGKLRKEIKEYLESRWRFRKDPCLRYLEQIQSYSKRIEEPRPLPVMAEYHWAGSSH